MKPDRESLISHKAAPEWFQDAKLGYYFHWVVYSVTAFRSDGQIYFKEMNIEEFLKEARELEKSIEGFIL